MHPDLFPERLTLAIEKLSQEQVSELEKWGVEQDLPSTGIKWLIAARAGMGSAPMLSDILAGRTPGRRYRQALADVVGVNLSWLEGGSETAPDWTLSPYAAFRRWSELITKALQNTSRRLHRPIMEEDSGGLLISPSEAEWWCRRLDLPLGTADVSHLLSGRHHAASFEVLLRMAQQVGLPRLMNPSHVRQGHAMSADVAREVELAIQRIRHRYVMHLLPAKLFQMTRYALVLLKGHREYRGRPVTHIDDALELIWRQELIRHGTPRNTAPTEFSNETGRGGWTPLARLQSRYPDDGHLHVERYDST